MRSAIILYMPVPHLGYLNLIERNQPADVLLLSLDVIKKIDTKIGEQLSRDMQLRGISPILIKAMLNAAYGYKVEIKIVEEIEEMKSYRSIIMPDEDLSHVIKAILDPEIEVIFDNQFTRWDWRNTNIPKETIADYTVSTSDLDRELMKVAEIEAQKSSDFWRQVGALVPLDDRILVSFNEHMPTQLEPYINGCMRLIMQPGEKVEICGAIHAEKAIFAQAAREGIPLYGRDMYVTTFPCLSCAQMIAKVGIKRLFFRQGYSNQNALEDLRAGGVEIIQVN